MFSLTLLEYILNSTYIYTYRRNKINNKINYVITIYRNVKNYMNIY